MHWCRPLSAVDKWLKVGSCYNCCEYFHFIIHLFYIEAWYSKGFKLNTLKTFEWVMHQSSLKNTFISYMKGWPLKCISLEMPLNTWRVCVAYLSFPMMHIAASSGSASWINFLNIFNRLFIFSISSGTNNARLAAMLRQLAQYHAKDPNNLFMVRLAQVGGSTKGILYQTRSELLGKCVCVYQLLLTLSCLCVHRVWLTWAKAHWHSVPTIATGSWWVRSPWLDCSPCSFPSSTSRTVS